MNGLREQIRIRIVNSGWNCVVNVLDKDIQTTEKSKVEAKYNGDLWVLSLLCEQSTDVVLDSCHLTDEVTSLMRGCQLKRFDSDGIKTFNVWRRSDEATEDTAEFMLLRAIYPDKAGNYPKKARDIGDEELVFLLHVIDTVEWKAVEKLD